MKHNSDPGPIEKGPSDRFTGDVWLWPSVGQTTHADIRNVMFTPGSRSAWHCHPDGQVLHVTNGLGLVQNRGESPRVVRAGDTISCEPGEWHWHGALPDSFMSHIAVTDGPAVWGDQVTADEAGADRD